MAEIILGLHIEGADADIAELKAYLESTKQMDFATVMALLGKMTGIKITEITATTTPVSTIDEKNLYPK